MVLEKTIASLLDSKEIKPVNPKENQSWIFTGGTDAVAEALILWPPDAKSRLTGKDPDAGKDWKQEKKGMTEDKIVGWHHWLNGHEFEQAPGNDEGQGSLGCCNPWGCKESDTTEWLNNNKLGGSFWLYSTIHGSGSIPSKQRERHSNELYKVEDLGGNKGKEVIPAKTELLVLRTHFFRG